MCVYIFCVVKSFRDLAENDPELLRLELDPTSSLFAELCASSSNGTCTFPSKVVLQTNLDCSPDACDVDTIRTVRIQSLPDPIYYEYVRIPCVEQAYYNNAVKLKDWTRNDYSTDNMICGDTRRDYAAG